MAIIKCNECGREISDKAAMCVGCGCPLDSEKKESSKADAAHKADTSFELTGEQLNRYELMPPDKIWSEAYRFHYRSSSQEGVKAAQLYNLIIEKYADSPEADWAKQQLRSLPAKSVRNEVDIRKPGVISEGIHNDQVSTEEKPKVTNKGSNIGCVMNVIYTVYALGFIRYWFVLWNDDYPYVSLTSLLAFPFYSFKAATWPLLMLFGR